MGLADACRPGKKKGSCWNPVNIRFEKEGKRRNMKRMTDPDGAGRRQRKVGII